MLIDKHFKLYPISADYFFLHREITNNSYRQIQLGRQATEDKKLKTQKESYD